MSPLRPPSTTTGPADITVVRHLLPYLWRGQTPVLRARIFTAVALLLAAKIATIYVPVLYKQAVDALTLKDAAIVVPVALILAYGATRVLSATFQELRTMVFDPVAQHGVHQVALATFRHLHRLSLRFHLDRQTGGLSRAIERGINAIENLVYYLLFQILPTLLEITLVSAVLWWLYDWRFAAVTFVTIAAYTAWTLAITQWRLVYRRRMLEAESEANAKAVDSLLNYETVKYFSNEEHEARRFDVSLTAYEKAAIWSANTLSLLNIGQAAVIAVGVTGVMLLAAQGVTAGRMTLGDFVMVNAYLIQLYLPLNFLGMMYRELRQALTDLGQMFRLLEVEIEVRDESGAPDIAVSGGAVRFAGVRFAYDKRREILKGVDFGVPPGRTLAIVGPSGAGKSTIARLLFRFYDVTGGAITIDGQDVRTVSQASLRRAIGIVPQDTVLFNDTIYYNIAYGRPDASPTEVEEAARLARIHDFVMATPDGYQTRVGERGLKLSGGERQRVAIARTILKRPRVLIFDEATSALDTRTERAIQESLRQISRGVTTVTIAHRLSTIVDADEIVVLQDGVVVERGRHAELLALA
ncbi:MAG: ABC transporter ATP-binding protein/permease, partial [Alphaproteobacteria bacterium]|nr:ABC transporter ATP-binding protein/permease [Alphaproteobacteria bacterium]